MQSRIETYGGTVTLKAFNEGAKGLQLYIDELFEMTQGPEKKDNMDFSQYAFNMSYERHFYVTVLDNVEVDLENFAVRLTNIHDFFNSVTSFLYKEIGDDYFGNVEQSFGEP